MTTQALPRRVSSLDSALVPGVAAGVAVFAATNALSSLWLAHLLSGGTGLLVLTAACVGGAVLAAGLYPRAGLFAGLTMLLLIAIGLALGGPVDIGVSMGLLQTPSVLIHQGAHDLIVVAAAVSVVAAAGSAYLRDKRRAN